MIVARLDTRGLERGIRTLVTRADPDMLASVFRKLKQPMAEDQREHAQQQVGPDGTPWPARDASTEAKVGHRTGGKHGKKKKRVSRRPLRMLGRLPTSVKTRAKGAAVFSYPPVAWAWVHQAGGRAGRSSLIPPRPFVYVSEEMDELAQRELADFIVADW